MSVPNLVLIDGHSAIYRAFYAIRDLSTTSGQPTNAVFGFIRMLRAVRRSLQPTHCAVVFDAGKSEARQRLLPSYKAQRSPMPDELRGQIPLVQEYLDAWPIPWLSQKGVEGDDLIATITKRARAEGADVRILGSDKDFFQLVDEHTKVMPSADMEKQIGVDEVVAKTGVVPALIVEWLALMGDHSDNIPGVPGVGAKTATKLLNEHGGLDGIWQHLADVSPQRIRDSLAASRSEVERNVELVRLADDLAYPIEWEAMELTEECPGRVLPLLNRLELQSLARELEEPELLL